MVNALTLTLAALASALGLAVAVLAVLLAWSRCNERRGWDLANFRNVALHAAIHEMGRLASELEVYRYADDQSLRDLLEQSRGQS